MKKRTDKELVEAAIKALPRMTDTKELQEAYDFKRKLVRNENTKFGIIKGCLKKKLARKVEAGKLTPDAANLIVRSFCLHHGRTPRKDFF